MSFSVDEFQGSLMTLGQKGGTIDYSGGDVTLGDSVKAVVVLSAGNVVYRPRRETSGSITMSEVPTGVYLPHIPGVIFQSGTTATLATVED